MAPSTRSLPTWTVALVCALSMFVLAVLGIELTRFSGRMATVWVANGVIIAMLVRQVRARWRLMLLGAWLGNVAAALTIGDAPALALALSTCNLLEIVVVATLLARHVQPHEPIDSLNQIGWLGLLAIVGPLVSTPLAGLSIGLLGAAPASATMINWLIADILGIMVVTPLLLTLTGPRLRWPDGRMLEFLLFSALGVSAAFWVFSRSPPLLFLLGPVLVFAGLRLRLDRAAVLVALICAISVVATMFGHGPIANAGLADDVRNYLQQAFMATAVMLTLPVAALGLERERAAAELHAREEQYRLLADHGSDLVLRLSAEGKAEYVSSAATRLLGLDPAELRGPALIARMHDEDRPRFLAAMERVGRNGEAVCCFRMRHARGTDRWIEAHLRRADVSLSNLTAREGLTAIAERDLAEEMRDAEERPSALRKGEVPAVANTLPIVASLRDVHHRRNAEIMASQGAIKLGETNRLLLMAEGLAGFGHWLVDQDTNRIVLSGEAAILLDQSQRMIEFSALLALVDRHDRGQLLRRLVLAGRGADPVECVVRMLIRGEERTMQVRLQRSGEQESRSLFGVVSDITDKLAAQRRLVVALQEARSAALFRSQFLATMSHEIRTPMTGVIGMIELLSGNGSEAERRLYLETLRHSADVLMAVLNDILDFSKVDAGHLAIADEPFDLGLCLLTTLRLFDRAASTRGLGLRLEAPVPGAAWLRGDALRLQQIVSNLLNNAIKFSDRGEVALRCTIAHHGPGRKFVRITVEDQGCGISPAVQAKLFEPFVQGGNSNQPGGTGLGLAISRRLVGAMGGTIDVHSVENQGTTFTLALELPEAEPQPVARTADVLGVPDRSLDLLLAEDNPVNQLLVTALLKRLGHRVTCASDGELALICAEERRFDLILMDMQMPRRDGLATTAAIRSGGGPNAATPIIALTADAAAERRTLYSGNGIDGLLTKPINSAALAATLADFTHLGDQCRPGPPTLVALPRSPLDDSTLAEVRRLLGPARLDDLLALLSDELEARPRAIREALSDHDLDRAKSEAHSLKGAAANLGAHAVAQAAVGLEESIALALGGERTALAPAMRELAKAVTAAQHVLTLRHARRETAVRA